jgi:hypothetical protein
MPSWGECYYDHFTRLFQGEPVDRQVFRSSEDLPSIQVLGYDRVFQNCRTFATMGAMSYQPELGRPAEVIVPVDEAWDAVPHLIASSLFYMVQNAMAIGPGISIRGVAAIDRSFAERFQKAAIYYSRPIDLPPWGDRVVCGSETGSIYLGIFISAAEDAYFRAKGADALEDVLQAHLEDPYHLARPSCPVPHLIA